MDFHKLTNTDNWINYEAIAENTTKVTNAVIEYGRKFDGTREWKSGNFYHLKADVERTGKKWDTKEEFTFTQKCELFAVTHFNGAISVILITESRYRDIEHPFHEIQFFEGVREAYNEDYDEVEDRQLEALERLMTDGYRAIYGFDHDNGKTEYVEFNRFYGCNVFPDKETGNVDAVDIKEYHVGGSNFSTRDVSKYSRMLEDIILIPVYIDYDEKN